MLEYRANAPIVRKSAEASQRDANGVLLVVQPCSGVPSWGEFPCSYLVPAPFYRHYARRSLPSEVHLQGWTGIAKRRISKKGCATCALTLPENTAYTFRRMKVKAFASCMSSAAGRIVRVVAGIFDFCVFAPLFGAPLRGAKVRDRQHAMVH